MQRRDWGEVAYDTTFDRRADRIKREYAAAEQNRDFKTTRRLRHEWMQIQEKRKAEGYRPQTFSDLRKSVEAQRKRTAQSIGGVPYSRSDQGAVENVDRLIGR